MVIDAVPKSAAPGPRETAPADPAALRRGLVLDARILEITDKGTVRLSTRLGEVSVPAEAFKAAHGDPVAGRTVAVTVRSVEGGGVSVALAEPGRDIAAEAPVSPEAARRAALAGAVAAAAGRQGSLARLFADLQRLAASPGPIPDPVRTAAADVLAHRLPLDRPPTAAEVRNAVLGSGLFLESDLAGTGPGLGAGRPPGSDLKAALLGLRRALEGWAPAGAGGATGASGGAPRMGSAPAGSPGVSAQPGPAGIGSTGAVTTGPAANPPDGRAGAAAPTPGSADVPIGGAASPATAAPQAPGPGGTNAGTAMAIGTMPSGPGTAAGAGTTTTGSGTTAGAPTTTGILSGPEGEGSAADPAAARGGGSSSAGSTAAVPVAASGPGPVAGGSPSSPVPPTLSSAAGGGGTTPAGGAVTTGAPGDLPVAPPPPGGFPTPGEAAPAVGRAEAQILARVLGGLARAAEVLPGAAPAPPGRNTAREAGGERDAATVPPPIRGGPLRAEGPVAPGLPDEAAPAERAAALRTETEGALARILLSQYASLGSEADSKAGSPDRSSPQWTFEVPVLVRGETGTAQFRIERDDHGRSGGREPGKPVWRVRFSLALEPFGLIHALLSLQGEHLSVGLWAERAEAAAALGAEIGELRDALTAASLEVDEVHCATGAPPAAPAPGAGRLLDRNA